jgi:hypothetical protein
MNPIPLQACPPRREDRLFYRRGAIRPSPVDDLVPLPPRKVGKGAGVLQVALTQPPMKLDSDQLSAISGQQLSAGSQTVFVFG